VRFMNKFGLPLVASAAMALIACSSSGAPGKGNDTAPQRREGAENRTAFRANESAADVARALCIASARQIFAISADDVTGSTFGGGGESPQSVDGQITLDLFGPPSRHFRCELAGGAVTSLAEVDADGHPVAGH
jgi:hypothetical protein